MPHGGYLYVGGSFATIGGRSYNLAAILSPSSNTALSWNTNLSGIYPPYGTFPQKLSAIAFDGSRVYLGGAFASVASLSRPCLAGFSGVLTADVSPARAPAGRAVAAPNPFRRHTELRFAVSAGVASNVAIHDVTGRRIRAIPILPGASGEQRLSWDGRDDWGHDVAPGLYFARIGTGAQALETRVLRVR